MITILKYELGKDFEGEMLLLPADAKILTVKLQGNCNPAIWVLLDTEKKKVKRWFVLCGTGSDIGKAWGVIQEELAYIGTYRFPIAEVYHLFERIKEKKCL